MAHFAKIENGIVLEVLVVDNEHEAYGELYLNKLGLSGTWIQTSYNGNIRGKYAALGDTYEAKKDRFKPKRPYVSWKWNEQNYLWVAPIAYPNDGLTYFWDESVTDWVLDEETKNEAEAVA
jgi:hypothetical protein